MVYLAAFFITTWLEIIGTAAGTWRWARDRTGYVSISGKPPKRRGRMVLFG